MNPPVLPSESAPSRARMLGAVTLAALRSTVVIMIVALAVFALRHQAFDGPTLMRTMQDNRTLFVMVFTGVWIWRFWRTRRP